MKRRGCEETHKHLGIVHSPCRIGGGKIPSPGGRVAPKGRERNGET